MKILLIEDNDDDATLVRVHLNRADRNEYVLHHVATLQKGIEALHRERWDAVLLDLGLPESKGLDTLNLFRTAGREIPVIVLSGETELELATQTLQLGAHDVLDKGDLTEQSLVRSLRYAQERFRLVQEIRHQSLHDPLTGLPNRTFFDEQVEGAIAECGYNGESFVILFLDLDGFKLINDLGGHECGDRLLVDVASRLKDFVRKGDVLSRLGGDEFASIVFGVKSRVQAEQVADRIHATLAEPFLVGSSRVRISTSVGIVPCDGASDQNPSMTRLELLRGADMAMYAAKARGPGQTQFFDDAMRRSLIDRAQLEQSLQNALLRDELKLHYQPIVDLVSGRLMGLEALCRWMPEGRSPVPPTVFIPIAEQTGLIQPIGRWVLQQACADFAEWKRSRWSDGLLPEHVTLHVNVSRLQLSDAALVPTIAEAIAENDFEPAELTIEVTESCIIEDDALAKRIFDEIKALGVRLCIDDFGVGYSSLGHLSRFPFDCLKIDRSFVAQLDDSSGEPGVLLEAIATLAASLGLETVAEGVETESQAARIRQIGCPLAQGFLFARPAPIETFLNHAPVEVLATC